MQVQAAIEATVLREGGSMSEHLTRLRNLFSQLRELGQPLPEQSQKHTLLKSLPQSWSSACEAFMIALSMSQVVEGLRQIAQSRGLNQGGVEAMGAERAFIAQGANSGGGSRCWDCCKPGHSAGRSCPNWVLRVNVFGSSKTEELSKCWKAIELGQSGSWNVGDRDSKRRVQANVAEAAEPSSAVSGVTVQSTPGVPLAAQAHFTAAANWTPTPAFLPPMPAIALCANALVASDTTLADVFYIDSGCSSHMTHMRSLFTSFQTLEEPISVEGIGKLTINATGVGTVLAPTLAPEGLIWTTL
ncbi:hypothetical protein BDV93DRAFT_565493 [Ceratobasidium sp. AG-I]|nr:hypothetical protein BDV93DRAFT_565493 [Ceratobasidium sp. AG-I]